MRKTLVIGPLAVFVLSLLGNTVAYAIPTPQGSHSEPTLSQSPHGGYVATGDKCKACHAVATTPALLTSTANDPCTYCHITTAFATKQVYSSTGDATQYTTDTDFNHSATHAPADTTYNGCTSCHAVHGANTIGGGLASFILRKNPGGAIFPGNTVGGVAADATNLDEFCRDCHDGRNADGSQNDLWGSSQCGGCHTNDPSDIYPGGLNLGNKWSHIMSNNLSPTDQTGFTYPSQVAWDTSETCRKCHRGGSHTADNSFPHRTAGVNFLSDLCTTIGELDRVCIDCHLSGGSGVGLTL